MLNPHHSYTKLVPAGAIAVTGNATLSIKSSQFIGNTAWYGRGAGLFVGDQARVTVANSTFRGHVGT